MLEHLRASISQPLLKLERISEPTIPRDLSGFHKPERPEQSFGPAGVAHTGDKEATYQLSVSDLTPLKSGRVHRGDMLTSNPS